MTRSTSIPERPAEAQPAADPTEALGSILDDLAAHLAWRAGTGTRRVPAASSETTAGPETTAPETTTPETTQPGTMTPETRAHPSGPLGYAKGVGSPALEAIRHDLGDCARCKLHGGRKNLVFGVGNPDAELVFVGEGPGANEDAQGEPFVGAAGQLLDKMIGAMGYRREDVYICNVVKCRPPGNRDPEPDEVAACEPFLKAQLAAIRPKVIVGLGRFAVQCLLGDPAARITRVRGKWARYADIDLMPTFHPAYLLRNAAEKRLAWQDLQAVMQRLGKAPS